MHARGMSVRDIRGHLEEFYGLEVSPDLISRVTDAVLDEVEKWRSRALDTVYPIVIFDALRVKIRDKDSRIVTNRAVYLALGVTGDGQREVRGLWMAENEGAKFWLAVMTELRNRRVQDILIAVVDGLKGFPEAINAAFPETTVQTCIVHLVRHSLNFCSWKDSKAVAAKLREVYSAETADTAREALEAFDGEWGRQYPSIAQAWRRAWQEVIPFFAFSPEIRRVIYTTNAIESLNRRRRGTDPPDRFLTLLHPEIHQDAGVVPVRGRCREADLPGDPRPRESFTDRQGVADSGEPVRHNVRGSLLADGRMRAVKWQPDRRPIHKVPETPGRDRQQAALRSDRQRRVVPLDHVPPHLPVRGLSFRDKNRWRQPALRSGPCNDRIVSSSTSTAGVLLPRSKISAAPSSKAFFP